jgi:pimeloyl-ACP methyl ester carboxylesterase
MFDEMEPLFEQRAGWRRIYFDLPGMGRTPAADWINCQDHLLEVALEFLDKVAPGEHCAVAGISMGGNLARGIVQRRLAQIDGVMLAVPYVVPYPDLPQLQVLAHDPAFVAALEADEQWLLDMIVVQSPEVLTEIRHSFMPAIRVTDPGLMKRMEAHYGFSFDVDSLPEPCAAPTLIITGRQDVVCGYRDAWKVLDNFPRATFAVLDRAGHMLNVEQKALFGALVSEWLDRVEEYTAGN